MNDKIRNAALKFADKVTEILEQKNIQQKSK